MNPSLPTPVHRSPASSGFTLVEMMIVVVVIGILALLSFQGMQTYRERAFDAAVKSDLRNALAAEEGHYATHGSYTAFEAVDGAAVDEPEFIPSARVTVEATLDGSDVRIEGSHAASSTSWCITSSSGKVVEGTGC